MGVLACSVMTILFAVLTAAANAVAVATQHVASTSEEGHRGWRFVLFLVRHPLWLFGWLALAASLVFQAVALHFGPMSIVQPFLVTELVIALVLRRVWIGQTISARAWTGALVTALGLGVFLVAAAPRRGGHPPTAAAWTGSVALCALATLVMVMASRGRSKGARAALFGGATGVLWALEATFIKATTDSLSAHGLAGALAHWPLYAFVMAGAAGLVTEQTALHVGPLKDSQPFIVIVDPLVSVALGLSLYHERLTTNGLALIVAAIAFVAMALGVVILTRSTPESMHTDLRHL
jgi:hypothetical protein